MKAFLGMGSSPILFLLFSLQHSHSSFNEITNKTQSSKKATITSFQFIKMEGGKGRALTLSIHHFHTVCALLQAERQGSRKLIVEVIGVVLLQLKCHFRIRLNSQHKYKFFLNYTRTSSLSSNMMVQGNVDFRRDTSFQLS